MLEEGGRTVEVMVTARTASATANSSRDGSKKIFSPTEAMRSVMGAFDDAEQLFGVFAAGASLFLPFEVA